MQPVDTQPAPYPARVEVDYPDTLNRLTTALRLVLAIPILMVISLVSGAWPTVVGGGDDDENRVAIAGMIGLATALMILFRRRYPRWWFDFQCELARFAARVGAYLALLTDRYPSTVERQGVHLEIDYPDVRGDLNRWLPLVKWLLALPHVLVLVPLAVACLFAIAIAWFAILLTGGYPRGLFDFVVGFARWSLRVSAYAILLVTDRYPPFSLR